jgi:hypothetical protein
VHLQNTPTDHSSNSISAASFEHHQEQAVVIVPMHCGWMVRLSLNRSAAVWPVFFNFDNSKIAPLI